MENNIKEIWKPVKGYENLYEVSNIGNVKSLDRIIKDKNGIIKIIKGKNHKLYTTKSGYVSTSLYKNSEQKVYRVHRLVAEAFIPNPNNLPQINHIDENKENNCAENLEWCTGSENCKRKSIKGERKVLQYDKNGNFIKEWDSIKEASENLNIKYSTLQSAITNNHFCFGYFWRYFSENYPSKIEVKISIFCGRPVYQYDLQGNFIKEWNKVCDITEKLHYDKSGINKICREKNGYTYKGFQWRYKDEIIDPNINIGKARIREGIYKIDQYSLDGIFIKTWDNARKAALYLGMRDGGRILNCCKNIQNQCMGFKWKYHNEI